ncbi:MAG: phage Gp37/Gp68 family protein [Oscillospiraceae bacterium]|nr:phage Gp37/Gp68 family protein [Oscillospiraceae bacterium]
MPTWNPWHGCHKISDGCKNCYVYCTDAKYDKDSAVVKKNAAFDLPIRKNRAGGYKLQDDDVIYTCFTSDFFLPDADEWRPDIWKMIRARGDLRFLIITKRIDRFRVGLPEDWGDGYENVCICATAENQDRADYRLPILIREPVRHKMIVCSPLLGPIDLAPYLSPAIEKVIAGGESGSGARVCSYDWILAIREQCRAAGLPFHFEQTGARFQKDGKIYCIPRKHQHAQARKANIDLKL